MLNATFTFYVILQPIGFLHNKNIIRIHTFSYPIWYLSTSPHIFVSLWIYLYESENQHEEEEEITQGTRNL